MIEALDIRDIIAIFGLFTGFSYYVLTVRGSMRNQKLQLETRQAQLFMNIYNTFASKQYQRDQESMLLRWEFEDFDDFFAKYGVEVNPEEHAIYDMYSAFYKGIGVLVQRGLIDPELVYDLMNWSIITFWEKFESILIGLRELYGPDSGKEIEFLYNEMKRIQKSKTK
jgi:hypothetical protein